MARRKGKSPVRDWLDGIEPLTVVQSRSAELHRNIAGSAFPHRLSADQLKAVRDRVIGAFKNTVRLQEDFLPITEDNPFFEKIVESMIAIDIVSPAILEHRAGAALLVLEDGLRLSVNDEDHIAITATENCFENLVGQLEAVDKKVGAALPFAQNSEYGFLSANPDLVGTGLRLSCVFSFIGLYLAKELDQVLRGLDRLGFDVRPAHMPRDKDEANIDAPGFCYKVTLLQSMGDAGEIAARMDRICGEVAYQERNARHRALKTRGLAVEDFVRRAVGVGSTAVVLSESEALDILYTVAFGIDLGLLDGSGDALDKVLQYTSVIMSPSVESVAANFDIKASPDEPDLVAQFARATILREATGGFMRDYMDDSGSGEKQAPKKKRTGSGRAAKPKNSSAGRVKQETETKK